jgi:F-type H+-transporting ATPase subunit delta
LNEVVGKLKLAPIVKTFLNFLIEEKRINILPMIYKNVVVLDDHEKGFLRGTIEGAGDSADDVFLKKIQEFLTGKLGKSPELKYVKNVELTAGYRVTVDDLQLDASLENQLNKFKEQVLNS